MRVAGFTESVKLIVGLISKDEAFLLSAKKELAKEFGKIDFESRIMAFNYTDYYTREMGDNLKRVFLGFEKLIDPTKLTRIKILTNKLEERFSHQGRRKVNIDPGYIDLARLILASTKDFSHRICLGKGIYAEVTLLFKNKTFTPLEWTYPDYRTKDYIEVFKDLRAIYSRQISSQ
ncbi:MAG: DUF4416 family protein [Candidatus Omnitrophica bacterium]|nr:DUF4416 family protein [Candidatus Omnitrophota bacterium]